MLEREEKLLWKQKKEYAPSAAGHACRFDRSRHTLRATSSRIFASRFFPSLSKNFLRVSIASLMRRAIFSRISPPPPGAAAALVAPAWGAAAAAGASDMVESRATSDGRGCLPNHHHAGQGSYSVGSWPFFLQLGGKSSDILYEYVATGLPKTKLDGPAAAALASVGLRWRELPSLAGSNIKFFFCDRDFYLQKITSSWR